MAARKGAPMRISADVREHDAVTTGLPWTV
jgi:hypothetical protein